MIFSNLTACQNKAQYSLKNNPSKKKKSIKKKFSTQDKIYHAWHTIKISRHAKRKRNLTQKSREKSVNRNRPRLIKLADKDIKTSIINIFHMSGKQREKLTCLGD